MGLAQFRICSPNALFCTNDPLNLERRYTPSWPKSNLLPLRSVGSPDSFLYVNLKKMNDYVLTCIDLIGWPPALQRTHFSLVSVIVIVSSFGCAPSCLHMCIRATTG
ncbi:hypothetical protein PGT21_003363 [Puccinia graminis f. sp. tritici]|uniref:Uncharacterized protein n=1 Tax=Puccinia graminis f. sp. tritici TaxID=56615 RepID=A0A5B0MKT2_PUCGR|nr:hypothetical protein PGT21_003363 [Puccinia graminis f. sp. tritici]